MKSLAKIVITLFLSCPAYGQMPIPSHAPSRLSIMEIDSGRSLDSAIQFIGLCGFHVERHPSNGHTRLVYISDTLIFLGLPVIEAFAFDSTEHLAADLILPCGNIDYDSLFWLSFATYGEPLHEANMLTGERDAEFYLPMLGQEVFLRIFDREADNLGPIATLAPIDSLILKGKSSRWDLIANGNEYNYFWDPTSIYKSDTLLISAKIVPTDSTLQAFKIQCDSCFRGYLYSVGWFQLIRSLGIGRQLSAVAVFTKGIKPAPFNRDIKWEKWAFFEPLLEDLPPEPPPPPSDSH